MASGAVRIEALGKDNFDTWKLQMEAVLIKGDAWNYVNGQTPKPKLLADSSNVAAVTDWEKNDAKARSDIILSISPPELKQIKNCGTSREIWLRLEDIYQSKGPARKATLLKNLILCKMPENGDVREHLREFCDTVDKHGDMEIAINPNLLAILLLYSLPANFEMFRCAIESRDELPTPEILRIKIIEESDARKNSMRGSNGRQNSSDAMMAKNQRRRNKDRVDGGSTNGAKQRD